MSFHRYRVPALLVLVLYVASCTTPSRSWRVEPRGPVAAIEKQPDSARVLIRGAEEVLMLRPTLQGDSIAGLVRSVSVCGDDCMSTLDTAAVVALGDVTSVSLAPDRPKISTLLVGAVALGFFVGVVTFLQSDTCLGLCPSVP